jgi:electron transport complex protein RnfA
MSEFVLILAAAALVNNLALEHLLGICPLVAVSRRVEAAIGMACATAFVLPISTVSSQLLYQYLLTPLGVSYLHLPVFVLMTGAIVLLLGRSLPRIAPRLDALIGVYLPFTLVNTTVLGVALLNLTASYGLPGALAYGLGAGLGFGLVVVLLAALRERLAAADVPVPFQGPAIVMITLAILSMAFMGFTGLVKL